MAGAECAGSTRPVGPRSSVTGGKPEMADPELCLKAGLADRQGGQASGTPSQSSSPIGMKDPFSRSMIAPIP